jgi:pimeloyl-ACP methyl ester carboxylesterase
MPLVDRDGASIHYELFGTEGKAVLLTHGFSSSGAAFASNAQAIADTGCRVITWDLRGHGSTDAGADPSEYTVPLTLCDMAALLDEVGADEAVLGGHSLGGSCLCRSGSRIRSACAASCSSTLGPAIETTKLAPGGIDSSTGRRRSSQQCTVRQSRRA